MGEGEGEGGEMVGRKMEFHVGWSGWTRPPTMEGGCHPDGVCKRE